MIPVRESKQFENLPIFWNLLFSVFFHVYIGKIHIHTACDLWTNIRAFCVIISDAHELTDMVSYRHQWYLFFLNCVYQQLCFYVFFIRTTVASLYITSRWKNETNCISISKDCTQYYHIAWPRLEKIPIANGFVTQLHICAIVQIPHIYKKPIQTPNKPCTIEGGEQLLGVWAWLLNDRLSTTSQWSIKHLHWTIGLSPLLNDWLNTN